MPKQKGTTSVVDPALQPPVKRAKGNPGAAISKPRVASQDAGTKSGRMVLTLQEVCVQYVVIRQTWHLAASCWLCGRQQQ